MNVFSLMFVCAAVAVICGLVMRFSRKKNVELVNKAIEADDAEVLAKVIDYGKASFVIAMIVGALAAGTFLALALVFAFGDTTKIFTG